MSNEQLERGLQSSVKIFNFSKVKLSTLREEETDCTVTREELLVIKKASASMNRALTALVRESFESENRLRAETHMLRGIMKRELTDRDANRARVFDMFRRNMQESECDQVPKTTATATRLNAPVESAVAMDKALAGMERQEQSMRETAPVGRVNIHGAGLLSAKLKRDAIIASAS